MNWINKIKKFGESIKKILIKNFQQNLRESSKVLGLVVVKVQF